MLDGPVQACFENDEVATPLELLEVFDSLTRHESTLAIPPEEFLTSCRDYLLSLKPSVVVSTFQEEQINAIDFLLTDDCWMTKVPPFVKIIWFHAFQMIENHIIENHDDIVVNIGRQDFSEATYMLNQFFNGDDFSLYVCVVFGTNQGTLPQRAIARELATFIYFGFLERLKSIVRQDEICEPVAFDVHEMSEVGLSKVRHVGGWAVRKVLSRARRYVQKNVHTNSSSTLATVENHQRVCELLEENIIQPYHQLEESSQFSETLQVTEARQYRQRGLLHISDEAYLFFLNLEQRRVDLLNMHILKRAQEGMVKAAINSISNDEELKSSWTKCFQDDATKDKLLGGHIFHR